ncbi:MAG TPA: M48 family metalloprotease [Kofleriaceae bacterium]|nr:M48 family metalloprotease [Kofleriaceae bacterium]
MALFAAGLVAWSVLPRFDRFKPPGSEVTADEHPQLFAELRRVATATRQKMPTHVYLIPDVNAFVAQRGGWMGLAGRRVMAIGMPLLRTLQVDELRAVLAHEMGHFYSGDVWLGPWIHKTRDALTRTVTKLGQASVAGVSAGLGISWVFALIQVPFLWFLVGFLRISKAISRAQEYSADAVAVRAEGPRALIEGLKKARAAALVHSIYMRSEVTPLLSYGKLPAVGEGFTRFLASEHLASTFDEAIDHEMEKDSADPYDSHPPLRERIRAIRAITGPTRPEDMRRAISLVRDADAIEMADLESRAQRSLERIAWKDTAEVWAQIWADGVPDAARALAGLRVADIPVALAEIRLRASRVLGDRSDAEMHTWWSHVVGQALALLLIEAGFTATTTPGEPERFTRGAEIVEPFVEIREHLHGGDTADGWRARWEARGLAAHELVRPRSRRARAMMSNADPIRTPRSARRGRR